VDPVSPTPLEARFGESDTLLLGNLECAWRQLPPARHRLVAVLAVQADGAFSGSLGFAFSGEATPHRALVEDAAALASATAGRLGSGTKATSVAVTRLDRSAATLASTVAGKLGNPDRLGLVRFEFGAVQQHPEFDHLPLPPDGWHEVIEVPGPIENVVELSLELPEGWSVPAVPLAVNVKNRLGAVEVAAKVEGRVVWIRRTLRVSGLRAEMGEASDLRALLVAWRSPASRELWLRPPATRGPDSPVR
jgi:hypothetical protein